MLTLSHSLGKPGRIGQFAQTYHDSHADDERAAGDTYAVAKVAIALTTSSIIITDLAEIARTLSVVHLVEDIGLHQPGNHIRRRTQKR